MKLLELFFGEADYGCTRCLRLALLDFGLEIGHGEDVGWYVSVYWPWVMRGFRSGRWFYTTMTRAIYSDAIVARLSTWWANHGWNASPPYYYRCTRCGKNEHEARATGCELGPCPMKPQ